MKTRMVEVREGEWLRPIDWEYNFAQHFASMGHTEERKKEACGRAVDLLRRVESEVDAFLVTFAHSDVERDIYRVGMYDGWPYWKPTPALLTSGTLGPETRLFYDLVAVRCK